MSKTKTPAKQFTFIDVLNDSEGRQWVDAIEDVNSSLSRYPNGNKDLEEIKAYYNEKLIAKFGFGYTD